MAGPGGEKKGKGNDTHPFRILKKKKKKGPIC